MSRFKDIINYRIGDSLLKVNNEGKILNKGFRGKCIYPKTVILINPSPGKFKDKYGDYIMEKMLLINRYSFTKRTRLLLTEKYIGI